MDAIEGAVHGDSHKREADRFPCVLAAPRHFHLFVQDPDDDWSPTLEQVNAGTYDPLKLKRVSFYLDVGLPHGNPMGFGFDGSMIIPRNPHLRSADDAVDEFNRVVAALLIGGLRLHQVVSENLAFGSLYATGYYRYEHPHGILPTLHQAWGEAAAGGYLSIDLLHPPRVSKADTVAALDAGRPVLAAAYRIDPATLVMAFSHHVATEYRNSLVYSWLIVEQLVKCAHLRNTRVQPVCRAIASKDVTNPLSRTPHPCLGRRPCDGFSKSRRPGGLAPAQRTCFGNGALLRCVAEMA